MAERYGVKPKMFTKDWWQYFFMYYKWHTIAILFIAVLVAVGVSDCAKREKYDLELVYIGEKYFDETLWENIAEKLSECIEDTDENGEKAVGYLQLTVNDKPEYAEQSAAAYVKHDTTLANELSYLYIYDKKRVEQQSDFINDNFASSEKWLDSEVSDDMLICDGYAVSLKNSTVLKETGINSEDLYLLVKYDEDLPKVNKTAHDNAKKAANMLVK